MASSSRGVMLMGVAGALLAAVVAAAMNASDDFEETGGLEPDEPELKVYAMQGAVRERPGPRFSWEEVERTSTGLVNTIPDSAKLRFQVLHDQVLGPLREHLGVPVRISSGYRSEAVNKKVGGSATSRHRTGEAVDIKVDGVSPEAVAATIIALKLPFDQLIWYDSWVHVGIRVVEGLRGEVLYSKGKSYTPRTPRASLAHRVA